MILSSATRISSFAYITGEASPWRLHQMTQLRQAPACDVAVKVFFKPVFHQAADLAVKAHPWRVVCLTQCCLHAKNFRPSVRATDHSLCTCSAGVDLIGIFGVRAVAAGVRCPPCLAGGGRLFFQGAEPQALAECGAKGAGSLDLGKLATTSLP